MTRFILPIILIGISVAVFFMFTSPTYQSIGELKTEVTAYNEALDNSKALETEREKLDDKYKAISKDNLAKLEKLLPENVDNIRLILEIEKLANPHGMALKDVKYDSTVADTSKPATNTIQGSTSQAARNDYGTWNLGFSTTGTYDNFLSFVKDLENNLRLVDIVSVDFSSADSGSGKSSNAVPTYKFDFKIKTYWLKN